MKNILVKKRKKPSGNSRERSWCCVEFWIKKGYTLEEAKNEISRRQKINAEKSKIKRLNGQNPYTLEVRKKMSEIQKRIYTLEYQIEKYGEIEGPIKFEKLQSTRKISAKKGAKASANRDVALIRESNHRCIEYWLKRDYTEEQAKEKISKSQSRGIDFFIKKYGKKEGIDRFKKRNEKFIKTFMSNNDIEEVNKKRSETMKAKVSSHAGGYTEENVKNIPFLHFYIFSFIDNNGEEILKYGITKQEKLYKRWAGLSTFCSGVILHKKMNALEALLLEQIFHKNFRYSYSPNIIKTTECMLIEELPKVLEILTEQKII